MDTAKFKALEELKLTKEEAMEWIEHLWNCQIVKTPIALVYKRKDSFAEAYPYLDKSRKNEVIGLFINNKVWSLVGQQENVMFYDIHDDKKSRLPSVSDLKDVNLHLDAVRSTIATLRENGIEVEDFFDCGTYWTNQYYAIKKQTTVKVYSLVAAQEYEIDPSRGKVAHVRECYPFYTF